MMGTNTLLFKVNTVIAFIGGWVAYLVGGFTKDITTLIMFMIIDFIMGYIVAIVFKNSQKTETGGVCSSVGWKGLAKKCTTLLFVIVGYRLDLTLGTNYIKSAVCVGFIANELISIVENAGLMGVPLLPVIKNSIDLLKSKSDEQPK